MKETMMNRQPYKAEKRRKEIARQKKQEEKRLKRLEKKKVKEEGQDPAVGSSPEMELPAAPENAVEDAVEMQNPSDPGQGGSGVN
jgi:hypothetical protein